MRTSPAMLAMVLALAVLPAARAADPSGDMVLYLHRDGSIDAAPPRGAGDATFTFSLLPPHHVRFASAPLARAWDVRGPAELHLTLTSEYSVLSRLNATLDDGSRTVGASETSELILDGRPQEVVLSFPDLRGQVAAGKPVGLTVLLNPIAYVDVPGVLNLSLVDLKVDLAYDSTVHPSALHVLGYEAGAGGAPGSGGGSGGNRTGSGGGPGSSATGAPGAPGAPGPAGEPLTLLRAAAAPKQVVLMGLGSSGIALVAALMLRGRSGLG